MFASSILRAIIRRPTLWLEAMRALIAFTPSSWWKRAPFLPVPSRSYLRWRVQMAYGSTDAAPLSADVISFLEWRRDQR